jgi:hypothetical protein
MMTPFFLEEFAKTHHRDLLKEAEYWRKVSQARGKKSDKLGVIQRLMADVVKHGIEIIAESRFNMSTIQR